MVFAAFMYPINLNLLLKLIFYIHYMDVYLLYMLCATQQFNPMLVCTQNVLERSHSGSSFVMGRKLRHTQRNRYRFYVEFPGEGSAAPLAQRMGQCQAFVQAVHGIPCCYYVSCYVEHF